MLLSPADKTPVAIEQLLAKLGSLATRFNQIDNLDDLLQLGVDETKTLFGADRILLYQFLPGGDGVIIAESVEPGWSAVIGQLIYDPCFQEKWITPYLQGRVKAISNVKESGLEACHFELLTKLQVKANLVAPVIVNHPATPHEPVQPKLWALLIVQQCAYSRKWEEIHIQTIKYIGTQLGLALQHLQFRKRLTKTSNDTDTANLEQCNAQLFRQNAALNACADVIIITDRQGRIEWANPAFSTLTGYRLEEAIGKNPSELVKSGYQDEAFYRQLWTCILSGNVWRGELVNRRKDGSLYHEEMTITPVQNEQDEVTHFIAIKQDVSERHRMEQRLRDRDDMLRKISEQTPGVVYQYQLFPDGRSCFPYASEAIRCIYEVAPAQVQEDAQTVLERIHPDDAERVMADIWQSFKTLELWQDEYRVLLPERGLRWLEGHATPEPQANGSVLWHGYIWDITARKTLELALKENEALFRGLFEQAMVGISLVAPDGRFLQVNQQFCDLMGYPDEELRQKTFLDVTHPDDISRSLMFFRQVAQGNLAKPTLEKRYIRSNDEVWWSSITVSPVYDAGGKLQYVFGLAVDITPRKQAEAQLKYEFQRERMIHLIDHHMRQSLELETILQTVVQEVHRFLATDRVIVYCLDESWRGVVMAEAVSPGWRAILNQDITDSYFGATQGCNYHDKHVNAVDDVYTAGFSDCHLELLEWLQVRAKLVVPIVQDDRLWGLLIAHHCRAPRQWEPREARLLLQLADHLATAIHQADLHQQVQRANQELERISNTDALTQVANRRRFDDVLTQEIKRSQREHQPLALVFCDIDYFKQYNDTYGHPQGDACLVWISTALQDCLKRPADCLARYGGEEFAIILPNTDVQGALALVQEMQQAIADLQLEHQSHPFAPTVTISFGIAVAEELAETSDQQLIHQADRALYQAKAAGRNTYAIFSQP